MPDKSGPSGNQTRSGSGAFATNPSAITPTPAQSGLRDKAGIVASQDRSTGEKVRDFVEAQKNAGADAIGSAAHAAQGVADQLEESAPGVARVIRNVAGSVESASKGAHDTSLPQMTDSIVAFARSQPIAALSVAFVAGVLFARMFGARSA